jgi:hypothetical protein
MTLLLSPRICLIPLIAGALTFLPLAGRASAASFDITGTAQSYTLPSNFDPNWSGTPQGFSGSGPGTIIDIFYGANGSSPYAPDPMTFTAPTASGAGLAVSGAAGPVSLTYTFLGFEAAYTNQAEASFTYSSTPQFQNHTSGSVPATTIGASYTLTTSLPSSGLVPFLFNSTAYNAPDGTAVNGGPIGANVGLGFLIDSANTNIAYALLKDIWQGGDGDFDDMVVEIQLNQTSITRSSATPLSPSLPLFATGLGLIGLVSWLTKRKGITSFVC